MHFFGESSKEFHIAAKVFDLYFGNNCPEEKRHLGRTRRIWLEVGTGQKHAL
jgi:hypothetical protein